MTSFIQRDRAHRKLPAVALLLALSGVVSAQQPEPYRFGDFVEVQLVNVEVWVTDDRGDPVPGLDPGDFEVREDGEPVEIRYFAELDGERVVPAQQARAATIPGAGADAERAALLQTPTVDPNHLVIYFDQLHLRPAGRKRVIRDLRDFLASEPLFAERVLILDQDYSLKTEATFGSSWQELDAALERIGKTAPTGGRVQMEKRLAIQRLQDIWKLGKEIGGRAGSSDPCGYFLPRAGPEVELFARESRDRISITLDHLASAASFLTGLPGVKTLLYVSDSLERSPGSDLLTFVNGLCPVGQAPRFIVSDELSLAFRELTRHANANRVTIYALQAGGLEGSFVGGAEQGALEQQGSRGLDNALRFNERDGLTNLAAETGGRAIFNRNDFDGELTQIAREMGTYYSLAYTPPHSGDELEHRVDVEVKGRKLNVRHRRGYRDKSPDVRMTERLQGAVYLGLVANPMGVRLGAGEIQSDRSGTVTVPLHVMVPAENLALLPEEDAVAAHLTVMVSTRNTKTQKGIFEQSAFRIRRAKTEDSGLVGVVVELTLPPGVHLVAVGLRDDATGDTSFVTTTVELWPSASREEGSSANRPHARPPRTGRGSSALR